MSYRDKGYDPFLNKENTYAPTPQELDPLAFEQLTSSLSGEKIITNIPGSLVSKGINANNITSGQMSFDRAKGGSLILGGENDKNGTFSLRDNTDIERILLDKLGMTITGGQITIKDENNNTVVDSKGLSSIGAFKNYGYTEASNGGTTTAVDWTFDQLNLTLNFILERVAYVLFGLSISARNNNASTGDFTVAKMDLDGNDVGSDIILPGIYGLVGGPDEFVTLTHGSSFAIQVVQPGQHILRAKWKGVKLGANTTSVVVAGYVRSLFYLVLGT